MTTNRLAKTESPTGLTSQQWCDRGNAYLAGQLANAKGEFIPSPRHDVHWFIQDGRATIGWRR